MSSAQSLFLKRVNHEMEVRLLKADISEKTEVIEAQKARIAQLEVHLSNTISPPLVLRKLTEEQTQCSLDQEPQQEHFERLAEVLRTRESEAINLHLAIEQKEKEAENITRRLLAKEQEVRELRLLNLNLEKKLSARIKQCDDLRSEWKFQVERLLQQQRARVEEGQRKEQLLIVLQEEIGNLRGQEAKLKEENRAQKAEFQQLPEIINAKDWKLFCVQTELDLRVKQCHNLKASCDEQTQRIDELQKLLKQKQISLFSQEQENAFLQEQNQSLSTELKRKQHRIEQILAELCRVQLESQMQKQEQLEEFSIQLKKREEQLTACLNHKTQELDQARLHAAISQKEMQLLSKEHQRVREENYELQQSIIDHEEIMATQSERIAKLQEHIEAMNKRCNEMALLDIIKKQEWSQQKAEIEAQILRQTQKINRLTVDIIQRDIAANKAAQRIVEIQRVVESSNKQYLSAVAMLERAQAEAAVRSEKIRVQQVQLFEYLTKVKDLQDSIEKRETIIMELKERTQSLDSENIRLKHAMNNIKVQVSQLKGQVEFLRGSLNSLEEKYALKAEDCERINHENRDIRQQVRQLQMIKEKLENSLKLNEEASKRLKQQQKKVINLSQQYFNRVAELHMTQADTADQTTQFQILSEVLVDEKEEKHKIQQVCQEFSSGLKAILQELE